MEFVSYLLAGCLGALLLLLADGLACLVIQSLERRGIRPPERISDDEDQSVL